VRSPKWTGPIANTLPGFRSFRRSNPGHPADAWAGTAGSTEALKFEVHGMSRYAWLVCQDTKEMLWLGKIVTDTDNGEQFFHAGPDDLLPNSANQPLMKAVMKFLAKHIGKPIRVIPEEDINELTDESFTEIGDDPALGILLSDYIRDFQG
jgi:hypothetical protein